MSSIYKGDDIINNTFDGTLVIPEINDDSIDTQEIIDKYESSVGLS